MIPHSCIVKHDPPNSYGDCLRACIASLLSFENVELVPHFMESGDDETGNNEMKMWLYAVAHRRPFYVAMPNTTSLADLFAMMDGVNHNIPYLLFCQCGGGDHVVICKNDKVIHDPSWYRSPISGPGSSGFWVIMVLVPADT